MLVNASLDGDALMPRFDCATIYVVYLLSSYEKKRETIEGTARGCASLRALVENAIVFFGIVFS